MTLLSIDEELYGSINLEKMVVDYQQSVDDDKALIGLDKTFDVILLNFGNYKLARKILIENETIHFFEEKPYSDSATEKDGLYEVLNGELIAVFSKDEKNYLCLNGQLFLLTPEISIEYFIAQDMHTKSWFKLFKSKDLIFDINYLNPHEPFVLPDLFFRMKIMKQLILLLILPNGYRK